MRRPDGQDIDCMLHVNPALNQRGLAMVYNPLSIAVKRTLTLPLYYTGLKVACRIRREEGPAQPLALDEGARGQVSVEMGPKSATWFVIEP